MSDDNITTGERMPLLIADHRIAVLVAATVIVALLFTAVGLTLYHTSGTAQLDLSRPDFEGISEIVEQNKETYTEYPATGPINQTALDEFDTLYKNQIDNSSSIDAFGGDPLTPSALGIDDNS